ncbi:Rmt family 16S rRNA (guanine(1405)-N(7))-methyltransferase [Dictyobacter kobayashii]|uniref:16S rRNA (guanine(1405)-N(7))-methyltransferase n=1 Tax=Dictyobacter kobayashii TaxID=2014872 RepID=A0A402AFT9_9CHLR|nr:Rmt family 16S rRNA (guanine(1405)-N(7))-methyltransferase [Dictyobacter kobayashii]GCE17990.1 16S rRNA methyltransferase [Dictyobacter kobayashii]
MLKIDKALALEQLIADVSNSSKYKDICPELINAIGTQELGKRRSLKEAVKATKNKLHQIGGAYLDGRDNQASWLAELSEAIKTGQPAQLKQSCRQIMENHASTRERLPILDEFYTVLFEQLPPIQSILDIACGLNPLALPWMPLTETPATYYAYDIYQHMMDFLAAYFELMQIAGQAQARDVIQTCPTQPVDLALLLKVLPCLEQVNKNAAHQLLHNLNARHIIVSYPIQSLGGKSKGMASYYEEHFKRLVSDDNWKIHKLEFSTELVFLIDTEQETT